jgi:hypothetical protein
VSKTSGVTIQNLTVCDYLAGDGEHGNEIWWNGGDGSGLIGLSGWKGQYLTTYDTGLNGGYGIFISNSTHGSLDQAFGAANRLNVLAGTELPPLEPGELLLLLTDASDALLV